MFAISEGKGFAVVFLHGWGGSTDSFAFVASAFRRTYRTVRFDLAGFGKTPPPTEAWGAHDYAAALKEDLSALGIDECILVGHSFGGRVAIAFAADYPNAARAVVLVDSAGLRPKQTLSVRRAVRRYKRAKKKGLATAEAGSADYRAASPELRKTFVRIVNEDMTKELKGIDCPALLIWGTQDTDTPLKYGRKMSRLLRCGALVTLDGGHFSYLDQPYTFVRILDEFLRESAR